MNHLSNKRNAAHGMFLFHEQHHINDNRIKLLNTILFHEFTSSYSCYEYHAI